MSNYGIYLKPAVLASLVAVASVSSLQSPVNFFRRPGSPAPVRTVYKCSVIPGGVVSAQEAQEASNRDEVVRRHYAGVDIGGLKPVATGSAQLAWVSYRKHGNVYWTRNRVRIPTGELVLLSGADSIRARCGNRISATARQPVISDRREEPRTDELDSIESAPPVDAARSRRNDPALHLPPLSWNAAPVLADTETQAAAGQAAAGQAAAGQAAAGQAAARLATPLWAYSIGWQSGVTLSPWAAPAPPSGTQAISAGELSSEEPAAYTEDPVGSVSTAIAPLAAPDLVSPVTAPPVFVVPLIPQGGERRTPSLSASAGELVASGPDKVIESPGGNGSVPIVPDVPQTPVPEPAAWITLTFGATVLLAYRRWGKL